MKKTIIFIAACAVLVGSLAGFLLLDGAEPKKICILLMLIGVILQLWWLKLRLEKFHMLVSQCHIRIGDPFSTHTSDDRRNYFDVKAYGSTLALRARCSEHPPIIIRIRPLGKIKEIARKGSSSVSPEALRVSGTGCDSINVNGRIYAFNEETRLMEFVTMNKGCTRRYVTVMCSGMNFNKPYFVKFVLKLK